MDTGSEHNATRELSVDLSVDRRIIRIDIAPTHAGIAAALRKAFAAAADEPCDRDFDEILRLLH
jgi:hypothetical protein